MVEKKSQRVLMILGLLWLILGGEDIGAAEGSVNGRPFEGIPPIRFGADLGRESHQNKFVRVHSKMALHDLLDPVLESQGSMHLELMDLRGRYETLDDRVFFEELTVVRAHSTGGWGTSESQLSWRGQLGLHATGDAFCQRCPAALTSGGLGIAKNFVNSISWTPYFFVDGQVEGSQSFSSGFLRGSLGPSLGLRFSLNRELHGLLQLQEMFYLGVAGGWSHRHHLTLRKTFTTAWSLQIGGVWVPNTSELWAGFICYL